MVYTKAIIQFSVSGSGGYLLNGSVNIYIQLSE